MNICVIIFHLQLIGQGSNAYQLTWNFDFILDFLTFRDSANDRDNVYQQCDEEQYSF